MILPLRVLSLCNAFIALATSSLADVPLSDELRCLVSGKLTAECRFVAATSAERITAENYEAARELCPTSQNNRNVEVEFVANDTIIGWASVVIEPHEFDVSLPLFRFYLRCRKTVVP